MVLTDVSNVAAKTPRGGGVGKETGDKRAQRLLVLKAKVAHSKLQEVHAITRREVAMAELRSELAFAESKGPISEAAARLANERMALLAKLEAADSDEEEGEDGFFDTAENERTPVHAEVDEDADQGAVEVTVEKYDGDDYDDDQATTTPSRQRRQRGPLVHAKPVAATRNAWNTTIAEPIVLHGLMCHQDAAFRKLAENPNLFARAASRLPTTEEEEAAARCSPSSSSRPSAVGNKEDQIFVNNAIMNGLSRVRDGIASRGLFKNAPSPRSQRTRSAYDSSVDNLEATPTVAVWCPHREPEPPSDLELAALENELSTVPQLSTPVKPQLNTPVKHVKMNRGSEMAGYDDYHNSDDPPIPPDAWAPSGFGLF